MQSKRYLSPCIIITLLLLFPSCFVYKDLKIIQRDVKSIDTRLSRMEGNPEEIKKLFRKVKSDLKKIDQQLGAIKEIPLLINNQADLKQEITELKENNLKLKEKIEEYSHSFDLNFVELTQKIKSLEEELQELTLLSQSLSQVKAQEKESLEGLHKRLVLLDKKTALLPEGYKAYLAEELQKSEYYINSLELRINNLELKTEELFNLFKMKAMEDLEKRKSAGKRKEKKTKVSIEPKPAEEEKSPPPAKENLAKNQEQLPVPILPVSPELNSAELYLTAFNFYSAGKYEKAIKSFRDYLLQYPQTDLTDNAQYWIGEIFYRQKAYFKAKEEFNELTKKFPHSDKFPAAMLKIAFCQAELGDKKEALIQLKRFMERYPRTEEAKEAKERVELLEKEIKP